MGLQEALVGQFHRPHGPLGRLAGWIMARRESNLERNRWTVELLDLQPTDHVLELGPGPGVTLGLLLDRVSAGRVVGVDHSAAMLKQARARNREAVEAGRLVLVEGSFTALPDLDGPFDKILAVNSLQFDAANTAALVLRRVRGSSPGSFPPATR
ncbi:MAG: class I SAM-dependent methyltransferase, partial [Gammaproteobacteria bacterium]